MRSSSAAVAWSRGDLRGRWVALIVLGVLAGLTAGLATATFDGAQRTGTALPRLRERTNASDAVVFPSQLDIAHPDWTKLASSPEVETLGRWDLLFGNMGDDTGNEDLLFVAADGVFLDQIDRPIVVAGRMFDPNAPDEVIVTDDAAAQEHIHVGDVFPFATMSPSQDFSDPPNGPAIQAKVVGIVRTPLSYSFTGGAFLSPGFITKYGSAALLLENAVVQLRHGAADMSALRRDANTDIAPGTPVLDLHVTGRRVTATTDVEQAMLLLLAAIVALAGLVFIGQAVARSAGTIGTDGPTLRALGMSRAELVGAAVRPHLLTAAVALVVTATTAVVASRWFPVGLAAQVDPARGIRVNGTLFASAALVTAALVVGGAALFSWRAIRAGARHAVRVPAWLGRLGLVRPLTVGIGARMVVESSGRSGRTSSRPALIGAAAAVAGLVAIISLNHGLEQALSHPQVAGVAWDATVMPAQGDISATGVSDSLAESIASQPGVAATATIGRILVQVGDVGVPTFTVIDQGGGAHLSLVTLSGRAPRADDEVELGPSTARDLGVGIGDTLTLSTGVPLKVVGLGLFPSDVHSQFDEGAWITPTVWSALHGSSIANEDDTIAVAVRFSARSHVDAQIQSLGARLEQSGAMVGPVDQPEELTNLHNIRALPTLLAWFLSGLGILAVGHALFSSVRRRRKDFAVLRALGVTRGGSRVILAAYGSVVAIGGLIVGIPIGLLAGRAGWQAITNRVPLVFHSPLTAGAVLIVIPAAVLGANALAILPGRSAARIEPAVILRSE